MKTVTVCLLQEEFEDTKGAIRIRIPTTQWPKEKVQKDKQWSTKHTYKTKDRITRIPLKPGVNSGAPEGWTVATGKRHICFKNVPVGNNTIDIHGGGDTLVWQ